MKSAACGARKKRSMVRVRLGKTLYNISMGVLGILFLAVSVLSVGYIREFGLNTAVAVVEIFFLLSVYIVMYRAVGKLGDRTLRRVCPAAILLIFFGQVLFVMVMKSYFRADVLQVYNEAAEMIEAGAIEDNPYFGIYPNNIPITILTSWLLRLAQMLGISSQDWMRYLQVWNAAAISTGILFGYKLLLRMSGSRTAACFVAGCLVNPLIYFLAPWYYTPTVTIPFLMAGLYYLYCFGEERRYRTLLLSSAIFYMGFKIRPTVGIAVIAVLIAVFLRLLQTEKLSLKGLAKSGGIAAAAVLVLSMGYPALEDHYVKLDYTDTAYPAIQWIMMASHGTGGYNAEDAAYIEGFPTKEEKRRAAWERLGQYLEESSFSDKVKLGIHKVAVTWADGTDSYNASLQNSESYSTVYGYISGNNRDVLLYLVQAVRILNFAFICVGLYALLKRPGFSYIAYLTLAGGILFHILWEASSQYNVGFLLVMLLLQAEGFAAAAGQAQERWRRLSGAEASAAGSFARRIRRVGACAPVLLPLACIALQGGILLFQRQRGDYRVEKYYHYVLRQEMWEDEQAIHMQPGEEIRQTFTADKYFSKIGVKCYNQDDSCRGAQYELCVYRDEEEIYRGILSGDLLYGKDYYRVSLDSQPPGNYSICIRHVWSDSSNQIYFCNYGSENVDLYKGGTLQIGGKDIEANLTFIVYDTEEVIIRQEKDMRLLMLNAGIAAAVCLGYGALALSRKREEVR